MSSLIHLRISHPLPPGEALRIFRLIDSLLGCPAGGSALTALRGCADRLAGSNVPPSGVALGSEPTSRKRRGVRAAEGGAINVSVGPATRGDAIPSSPAGDNEAPHGSDLNRRGVGPQTNRGRGSSPSTTPGNARGTREADLILSRT
jgi:hypothetical protein